MKKIIIFVLIAALGAFAVGAAWKQYNYGRNLETATVSQEEVVGLDKKEVLARFGRPAAWGALADDGASQRREVLLYTTWTKNVVMVLRDDKVIAVKYRDVKRSALKQARSMANPKTWRALFARLVLGKSDTVPLTL